MLQGLEKRGDFDDRLLTRAALSYRESCLRVSGVLPALTWLLSAEAIAQHLERKLPRQREYQPAGKRGQPFQRQLQ